MKAPAPRSTWLSRVLWFLALYAGAVLALGIVAMAARVMLRSIQPPHHEAGGLIPERIAHTAALSAFDVAALDGEPP